MLNKCGELYPFSAEVNRFHCRSGSKSRIIIKIFKEYSSLLYQYKKGYGGNYNENKNQAFQ